MHNYIALAKWDKPTFTSSIALFIEQYQLNDEAINALYYRLKNASIKDLLNDEVLEEAYCDYIEGKATLYTPQYVN